MFSTFLLILANTCLINAIGGSVPLLLWGVEVPIFPALYKIQPHEFQHVIEDLLSNYSLNLYVESELMPQDFLCRSLRTNESCFRFLRKMYPSTYYMQVYDPVDTINELQPIEWEQFNSSKSLNCSVGTVHGFKFPDEDNGQRKQNLELHDAVIANFANENRCPLAVHIYTGYHHVNTTVPKLNLWAQYKMKVYNVSEEYYEDYRGNDDDDISVSRFRREFENFTAKTENFFRTDVFAIRYRKITYTRGQHKSILTGLKKRYGTGNHPVPEELTVHEVTTTTKETPEFGYVVTFEATPIRFTMDLFTPRGYKGVRIRTFEIENFKFGASPFNIPTRKSYVCNKIQALGHDKSVLTLFHVQMQGILYNLTNDTFHFGKPIYCTGIFTPNIITGLFIALIIMGIAGWGILCILDIGGNKYMSPIDDSDLNFAGND